MATLFDAIRKKYSILAKCRNCNEIFEVSIPKGIPIDKYFKEEAGVCTSCGCQTLERAIKKDEERKEKQYDAKKNKLFS